MATRVRLRRIGKNPKKRPHYRIAVYDETTNRDGRSIEELGYYNPVNGSVKINLERLDYWTSKGAKVSATIISLAKKARK